MISILSIERKKIILETTLLNIVRNNEEKGEWATGKEDSQWTLDLWEDMWGEKNGREHVKLRRRAGSARKIRKNEHMMQRSIQG